MAGYDVYHWSASAYLLVGNAWDRGFKNSLWHFNKAGKSGIVHSMKILRAALLMLNFALIAAVFFISISLLGTSVKFTLTWAVVLIAAEMAVRYQLRFFLLYHTDSGCNLSTASYSRPP